MAEVNLVLYQSPLEGASVALVYNDQTLQATHFLVTVPSRARGALTIDWSLNGVAQPTITANRGSQSSAVPLGQTITGAMTTDHRGETMIDFGITQIRFGFARS